MPPDQTRDLRRDLDHYYEQAAYVRDVIAATDPATDPGGTYMASLRRDLALWEQLAAELDSYLEPVETAELF